MTETTRRSVNGAGSPDVDVALWGTRGDGLIRGRRPSHSLSLLAPARGATAAQDQLRIIGFPLLADSSFVQTNSC